MINLLPYKEKKSIERVRGIRMAQAISIAFLILILAGGVLLIPTFITINSRFAIATTQIKTLERDGSITTDVDLSTLEKRAKTIKDKLALPAVLEPTEYIDLVKASTPIGITLTRFTTDDGVLLEVFGVAQSRELLQSFIASLEKNPKVALVDSPVSNFIKNKNGTFKLTVSFK